MFKNKIGFYLPPPGVMHPAIPGHANWWPRS